MKTAPLFSLALILSPAACRRASTPAMTEPSRAHTEFLFWITVDPTEIQLAPGAKATFRVNLNYPEGVNYLRPPVKWSVREGATGGTVDLMGHYTAPATPGTYHVVAERTDKSADPAIVIVTVK